MRYDQFTEQSTRLHEGLGKWIASFAPKAADDLGGQEEMNEYIDHYYRNMLKTLSRYRDSNNKPISKATLSQAPARALYVYLKGGMSLPEAEIARILNALGKRTGLTIRLPDVTNEDNTIADIVGASATSAQVQEFLEKLTALAAVRRMEREQFQDKEPEPAQRSASTTTSVPVTKPKAAPAVASTDWQPGQAIPRKDGTLVMPDDPNYSALARQYANLQSQGII